MIQRTQSKMRFVCTNSTIRFRSLKNKAAILLIVSINLLAILMGGCASTKANKFYPSVKNTDLPLLDEIEIEMDSTSFRLGLGRISIVSDVVDSCCYHVPKLTPVINLPEPYRTGQAEFAFGGKSSLDSNTYLKKRLHSAYLTGKVYGETKNIVNSQLVSLIWGYTPYSFPGGGISTGDLPEGQTTTTLKTWLGTKIRDVLHYTRTDEAGVFHSYTKNDVMGDFIEYNDEFTLEITDWKNYVADAMDIAGHTMKLIANDNSKKPERNGKIVVKVLKRPVIKPAYTGLVLLTAFPFVCGGFLVGMPHGAIRCELPFEISILDSEGKPLKRYNIVGKSVKWRAAYWGYVGTSLNRAACYSATEDAMNQFLKQYASDYPDIAEALKGNANHIHNNRL